MIFVYICECLLYIAFSIVISSFLLTLISEKHKPAIAIPRYLVPFCIVLIPILSYAPLHQVAISNAASFKLDYLTMIKSVILDLQIGQAWTWTVLGCSGLLIINTVPVFKQDRHMPKVSFLLTLLLTIWFGYASHAASLSTIKGLVVHAGHFLAVILWLGVLFIVAWFSKPPQHWHAFLNWFSPFAFGCVLMALTAGFTLMTFTTPQYVNSWVIPYGQMLLLKHISIIPLLWLGFTNGFLYKRKYIAQERLQPDRQAYDPIPMLRVESFIAIIVLLFTAIMGQQMPPHDLIETLRTQTPSTLFTSFFDGAYSPDIQLSLQLQMDTILLWLAAVVMLYATFTAFQERKAWPMLVTCLLFIVFTYLGFMFSLTTIES